MNLRYIILFDEYLNHKRGKYAKALDEKVKEEGSGFQSKGCKAGTGGSAPSGREDYLRYLCGCG